MESWCRPERARIKARSREAPVHRIREFAATSCKLAWRKLMHIHAHIRGAPPCSRVGLCVAECFCIPGPNSLFLAVVTGLEFQWSRGVRTETKCGGVYSRQGEEKKSGGST